MKVLAMTDRRLQDRLDAASLVLTNPTSISLRCATRFGSSPSAAITAINNSSINSPPSSSSPVVPSPDRRSLSSPPAGPVGPRA